MDEGSRSSKFSCHLSNALGMVPSNEVQEPSLFFVIPSQMGGRNLDILLWRVIGRYLRKQEEVKTQSNFQVDNKNLKSSVNRN